MTIASITTTKERQSDFIYKLLDGIQNQIVKFDKTIIYFQSKREDFLYQDIMDKYSNLEIKYVDNHFRSHCKYYYSIIEHPNDDIVMIDDDLIIKENVLKKLKESQELTKSKCLICNCFLLPLINPRYENCILFDNMNYSRYKNLYMRALSGWATLIPAHIFDNTNILDLDTALRLYPTSDECWIYTNCLINNIKTICCGRTFGRDINNDFDYPSALWRSNMSNKNIIQYGSVMYKYLYENGIDFNNISYSDLDNEI